MIVSVPLLLKQFTMTILDRANVYWSFGWLASDKLPGVALDALEQGMESPSVLELACRDGSEGLILHGLFEKALSELGRAPLSKLEAGRMIAREYAEEIANGKLSPIEGARLIWKVSLDCEELTQELGIFGGRASEYEDLPSERKLISDTILAEAKQLLKQSN